MKLEIVPRCDDEAVEGLMLKLLSRPMYQKDLREELRKQGCSVSDKRFLKILRKLVHQGKVIEIAPRIFIRASAIDALELDLEKIIGIYIGKGMRMAPSPLTRDVVFHLKRIYIDSPR